MGNKQSMKNNKPQFESINKIVEKSVDDKVILRDEDIENLVTQTKLSKEEIKILFDDFLKENPSLIF
jgi:hypothetical protein